MIQLLTLLNWFTTKKAFLTPYENNESAKKAATKLWTSVDKGDFIPFIAMIIIAIVICFIYYIPYNKKAGRHYKPTHWAIFLALTLVVTFAASYALLAFVVTKNASFDTAFIVKCSLMSTFYSLIVYIFASFVICKKHWSNAYPIF